jgi:hypothetical protein
VIGELLPGAAQDPRGRLRGPFSGGDEHDRVRCFGAAANVFGLRSTFRGQPIGRRVAAGVATEFESVRRGRLLPGFAYHAASVTSPRRILLLIGLLLVVASSCTGSGDGSPSTTTAPASSPVPTGPVRFQPGEYRYEFGGVVASLSFDGSSATLDVKNASGAALDPPALYVIDGTGAREDGTVSGAAPIPDGESATFQVTFPGSVTPKSIGLVILEFGDSNYGAFAPAPAT